MTAAFDDPNSFLMSGGTPAAKFEIVGTTVSGKICAAPEVVQQTDPKDNKPKFFSDGQPMMQMVVTVQTDLRDPQIADDDGQRKFYIKANSLKAVREAVRQSGARGLELGGILGLTYIGDGQRTNPAYSPPKLYAATYQPPTQAAANDFLSSSQQAPATTPAAGGPNAEALAAAGLTPEQIAAILQNAK